MEEKDEREGWNMVGLSSRKHMEGDRRKQKRDNVHRGWRGIQDKSKRHDRAKGKESAETESRRGRAPQNIRRVETGEMNENIPEQTNKL